jgi:RNA polymerase sigma-70 factor (ECF subfamily)
MGNSPTTRPSLLLRIRDNRDEQAWQEFVELYAPLVYRFARKSGLQDADAADVTQEVLRAIAGAAHRLHYDPERGSFRGWLFTVARNQLRDFVGRRQRPGQGSGDSATRAMLEAQPAPEGTPETWWNQEYEQRLFAWAADQVRPQVQAATWQAFWQTAVEGREPNAVAKGLGLSIGAVYIARSRVLARLRETIQQVSGGDAEVSRGGS